MGFAGGLPVDAGLFGFQIGVGKSEIFFVKPQIPQTE